MGKPQHNFSFPFFLFFGLFIAFFMICNIEAMNTQKYTLCLYPKILTNIPTLIRPLRTDYVYTGSISKGRVCAHILNP